MGHKSDDQKNKNVEFGTNCSAILFPIRNNPYTQILGIVGVGVDEKKIKTFDWEKPQFLEFSKNFFSASFKVSLSQFCWTKTVVFPSLKFEFFCRKSSTPKHTVLRPKFVYRGFLPSNKMAAQFFQIRNFRFLESDLRHTNPPTDWFWNIILIEKMWFDSGTMPIRVDAWIITLNENDR